MLRFPTFTRSSTLFQRRLCLYRFGKRISKQGTKAAANPEAIIDRYHVYLSVCRLVEERSATSTTSSPLYPLRDAPNGACDVLPSVGMSSQVLPQLNAPSSRPRHLGHPALDKILHYENFLLALDIYMRHTKGTCLPR